MKRVGKQLMMVMMALCSGLFLTSASWKTDFSEARQEARKENKLILLKFSGSDWCIPCIRMEKEIFSSDAFSGYAAQQLVMVNADFPRKNKLDKEIVKQNEALAEQYDKEGHFPYTVLLNSDGKVLKVWDGYQAEKPDAFIDQIKAYAGTPQ